MAYRRSRGKSKPTKLQPAPMTLTFSVTVPATGAPSQHDAYIDLSQCASLVNRRFYRQGINWAVNGFKIISIPTIVGKPVAGRIFIEKLPQTWVLSNAWEKGFRAWQQMISNATEESGAESMKGRFLDFKIFADAAHHVKGFGANLLPITAGSTFAVGQWQQSEYIMPVPGAAGTTSREIIAVGPNLPGAGASGLDALSLVQGYADSRRLPYKEDPSVPADADTNWLVKLFQGGTEQDQDVIDELETLGDQAPYPYEGDGVNAGTMYPGGETNAVTMQMHDVDQITTTTIGGTSYLKGGQFPCGLIKLNLNNDNTAGDEAIQFTILIDMVPGTHRGYLCEPMTDM